jgi:UPF0755 protein
MQDQLTPQRADSRAGRRDRPRRTSLLILFIAFLLVVGAAVAAASYYQGCQRVPDGPAKDVAFTVPSGATADQVVGALNEAGLIKCGGFVGNLMVRGTGKASQIRAGTYALTTGMTLDEIIHVLTTAPKVVPTANVLIPPGYRLTQIAERMHETLGISRKAFMDAAESGTYSLPPYLPQGSSTVEGFLWPETYRFAKRGTTPDDVITRLLQQFQTDTADLPWSNAETLGVTPYQIVVIASMIEKEATLDADRPKVAAVIYNRLAKGMTLGIDATVGYIDPDPSNGLTSSDLAIDSPYNTRLNPGLPPTPIASPGIASLKAALEPADVDYLYYVACGNQGASRFSTTYAQFLHDKAVCLG